MTKAARAKARTRRSSTGYAADADGGFHKEVICRAIMSIEGEELGPGSVNIISEILNVGPCGNDSRVLLLIDSGACLSVCPCDWCYWLPIRAATNCTQTVTATGKPLTFYGVRTVPCATDAQLSLDFFVADVAQPILAVADLQKKIVPDFGEHLALLYSGAR